MAGWLGGWAGWVAGLAGAASARVTMSKALQYEVELNEALCRAGGGDTGQPPSPPIIALCWTILDEVQASGGFGAYKTVMSQVMTLVRSLLGNAPLARWVAARLGKELCVCKFEPT